MKKKIIVGFGILSVIALLTAGCESTTSSTTSSSEEQTTTSESTEDSSKSNSSKSSESVSNSSEESSLGDSSDSSESSEEESSSSEPEITLYSVSVSSDESIVSYTLTGTDENNQAATGTVITLSVEIIDSSYSIQSVTSNQVTWTSESISDTSAAVDFVMPEENVSISILTDKAAFEISSITVYNEDDFYDFSISEGDTFQAGSTVEFTFYSKSKTIMGHYININGISVHPKEYTTTSSPYLYSASFTMPEENAEIICVYYSGNAAESDDGTYTITTQTFDGESYRDGLEDEHITFINPVYGAKYISANYYPIIVRDESVMVTGISYSVPSAGKSNTLDVLTNVADTSSKVKRTNVAIGSSNFAGDMVVTVNYTIVPTSTITYVNADDIEFGSSCHFDTSMPAGETAYIYYKGINGKYVDAAVTVTGVEEENIINNNYYSDEQYCLTYTVPENDVTLTFSKADNIEFSFVENELLDTQLYVYKTQKAIPVTVGGMPGASYTVGGQPKDGYGILSFTINGTVYTSFTTNTPSYFAYLKFTCPDTDTVTISCEVRPLQTATTDISTDDATVKFGTKTSEATIVAGKEATFKITPVSGKYVDLSSIQLVDSTGENVEYTLDDSSTTSLASGSFTMPESDVVLKAEFTTD